MIFNLFNIYYMRSSNTIFSGITTSGKKTFGQPKESTNAQDYIISKKNKLLNCDLNCNTIRNARVTNYSQLYGRNNITSVPNTYNVKSVKNDLVSGLFTEVDLNNINIISSAETNQSPTPISINNIPYLKYKLDPNGRLFGETRCGINNIINYIDIA